MVNATGARWVRKGRHLDGKKFACLKCIRGNRSEQCKPGLGKHMDDLRWIRQRGRPQGARNNLGPKQGRKFCPENFTALSEDEVGRVPAEEVLLPVEGNQAQVANGQMEVDPRLSGEAGLASLQAGPSMFSGGAVSFGTQVAAHEAELAASGAHTSARFPVEGNQAQVANGQEGVHPRLSGEADLGLPPGAPDITMDDVSMFCYQYAKQSSVEGNQAQVANGQMGVNLYLSGEAGLNPPQAEPSMLRHEADALASWSAEPLANPYAQLQEEFGTQTLLGAFAYSNGQISREEYFRTGGIPGTQAGYNNSSNTGQYPLY
ncbi:hypothetical protein ACHAPQ_006689 [Fusarium lateritium]